jgi:hypothetical protein
MTADPSPRGCEIPWRVRIRAASGTNPPVAVTGSILFVYFGSLAGGDVEGGLISLSKGNSVTKNIDGSGGMHAGRVRVTGTWLHSAFGVPGPLPVQLRFQILRPDGTVAASKTAYSNGEVNPCCSGNKMNFILDIRNHTTGQWKLRITNNSDHDVMNIDPKLQNVGGNCP